MIRGGSAKALFVLLPLLTGCATFHRGALPGEPAEATFIEIAGARVRYVDVGSGPAVVMLHGFGSSLENWSGLIPQLAGKRRVIALDLKGFGWTDRPAGDYSPAAQAELVLALLDARGVKDADVVAHSWGSSVALELALRAPERVGRIALYDAWVYEEQLPMFFHWARAPGVGEVLFALFWGQRADERMALAFHDRRYITEASVEEVERGLARPGTKAAALAAVRGQRYAQVQNRYRTIDRPVLLLWGREDRVTPLSVGERLSRELRRATLKVYPGCGHFPMREAAAASDADLLRFLEVRE